MRWWWYTNTINSKKQISSKLEKKWTPYQWYIQPPAYDILFDPPPKPMVYRTPTHLPGEKYFKLMRNFELRRSICKFRVSSHHLQIELGRYQGIPRHQRLCQQCSSGEVEDEIHFLFKCSKYEPDRKELIDIILTSCPNFNSLNDVKKLEWICNCENHNILTHLGVFLRKHCR